MSKQPSRKLIAANRKARHDYFIDATYEAGMVLTGTEVKSLRAGRATIVDGYATVRDGEVWLHGVHIPEYEHGSWTNHEPRRARKLLLHRAEINKMIGRTNQSGATLIPLSLYFADGYAKVELALARGRRAVDKRHAIAEREAKREAERAIGRRAKGIE